MQQNSNHHCSRTYIPTPRITPSGDRACSLDRGGEPFVTDISTAAQRNRNFRVALWTGTHLQMTLMSIPAGGEIGLEVHPDTDQYLRIEAGRALVRMGDNRNDLPFRRSVRRNDGIFVPAGTWHNIINIGRTPLKVSSVYAPPHHPRGTLQPTKADAEREEAGTAGY